MLLTFIVLVVVVAAGVWWINHKNSQPLPKSVLTVSHKVEEVAKNIADVNNDGKVDIKDAVAAVKKVEETGKKAVKTAKKITSKKKSK
jgi:hypothetical protein